MKIRELLYADDGKILTDGKVYGEVIYLGVNDSPDNWHEITQEEYEKILAAEAAEV